MSFLLILRVFVFGWCLPCRWGLDKVKDLAAIKEMIVGERKALADMHFTVWQTLVLYNHMQVSSTPQDGPK